MLLPHSLMWWGEAQGADGGVGRWGTPPPPPASAPQLAPGPPLPARCPSEAGRPPDSSSSCLGASNESRGHPGSLPFSPFPSPSFFQVKMGEKSQALGLSSSPPPHPLSPDSSRSLSPTDGKGTPDPGRGITRVSFDGQGAAGLGGLPHPRSPCVPWCAASPGAPGLTPPPFPAQDSWWDQWGFGMREPGAAGCCGSGYWAWGGARGETRLLGLGFGHWGVLLLPGMGAQICSSAL